MGKSASEMKADIESTRQDMSDTIDAIADRASPRRMVQRRGQRVADGWRPVRERLMGRAESAYGAAGDRAGQVPDAARQAVGTVAETAQVLPDKVVEQTQGNPIALGVVAFGAGLLLASLLPPTEAEQQAAARVRDQAGPIEDELAHAGRQVVDEVKSAAQEGVEQVTSTAGDAAGNVREDVASSAQHVADRIQG